jgi:uncharacterized protein (TIGR03435 family)
LNLPKIASVTQASPLQRIHCLVLLPLLVVALTACDKKQDSAAKPAGPKPPGTELSTVPGTSIKRVADDVKAEPVQGWTFSGLDAKAVELDDLVARTLPPDGWMGDAKLPEGKYDVKIDLSGKTPEEMRPVLFQAIESAFPVKLRLERKDMDGFVIRAAEGSTPPPALKKPEPGQSLAIEQNAKFWSFHAVTLDNFADWASRELGKPVANATDLPGKYTFELQAPAVTPASLTAAAKALGLEVTPQRLEQQVLVAEKGEAK